MEENIHPETLEETTPPIILSAWSQGTDLLAAYGWYFMGFGILAAYGWTKVSPKFWQWRQKQEEAAYIAKYHKNPDIARARTEALEASRKRMQEEYEKKAAEYAEKMKEVELKKEEEKREKRKSAFDGHTLGEGTQPSKSNYKPEYFPLAGSGGNRGYRPPRRSCCPSSGCG